MLQPTATNKFTLSKFQGQLQGNTLKGKIERSSWTSYSRTLEWEAKRVSRSSN